MPSTKKFKARLLLLAVALFGVVVAVASEQARHHWSSLVTDLSWKFGASCAILFGWMNNYAAALGVCVGGLGLVANICIQVWAVRRKDAVRTSEEPWPELNQD